MRTHFKHAFVALLLGTLLYPLGIRAQQPAQVDVPDDPEAAYEPLLRGPVHEAFAEPYNHDPRPTLVVPKAPPQPVEELPPEVRPEGENVIWLPGYWAWDDERDDYIWISGVWRVPPPDQRFVPGYWAEVAGGWQWVPGAWVGADRQELQYLPEPPATLEQGPAAEAPSDEHFWIPGNWQYHEERYVWRPGYWSRGYTEWVWMPAHYVWSPRGCIYVAGYWDYPLAQRGHLYAPLFFHRPVYVNPGFVYTPTVFIASDLLFQHFWVRPNYAHYYFGDFYDPMYANWGIQPWFRYPYLRGGFYDPLYAWNRISLGVSWGGWRGGMLQSYNWHVANRNWRPPHTWRNQLIVQNQINIDNRQFTNVNVNINNNFLGRNIRDVAYGRDSGFVRLDSDQRQRYRGQWDQFRNLSSERRQAESQGDWSQRRGARPDGAGREQGDGPVTGRQSGSGEGRGTRGGFRLPDIDPESIVRGDRGSRGRGEDPQDRVSAGRPGLDRPRGDGSGDDVRGRGREPRSPETSPLARDGLGPRIFPGEQRSGSNRTPDDTGARDDLRGRADTPRGPGREGRTPDAGTTPNDSLTPRIFPGEQRGPTRDGVRGRSDQPGADAARGPGRDNRIPGATPSVTDGLGPRIFPGETRSPSTDGLRDRRRDVPGATPSVTDGLGPRIFPGETRVPSTDGLGDRRGDAAGRGPRGTVDSLRPLGNPPVGQGFSRGPAGPGRANDSSGALTLPRSGFGGDRSRGISGGNTARPGSTAWR